MAGLSTGNFNIDGPLLGGTFGANFFEINGFVLGAEGDLDWAPIGGSSSAAACAGIGAPAGLTCQSGSHWLSTWRARAGYAFDRVLLYGTGGLALGDTEVASVSSVSPGWTAGGGVEVALADHWTAKIEYLFVDFGHVTCSSTAAASICGTGAVTFTENIVRGGVNWKFNW